MGYRPCDTDYNSTYHHQKGSGLIDTHVTGQMDDEQTQLYEQLLSDINHIDETFIFRRQQYKIDKQLIVNNKDVPLKIFVHSTYWTEEHFLPHLNRYPNSVIIDDAYYYLSGIDFTAAHPNTMVYVTGTEFMPMPGEYRLPYAQGRSVISNGMVTMTTSGSGCLTCTLCAM